MKTPDKSVAQAIGVAPMNTDFTTPMASAKPRWSEQNTALILPREIEADQRNIIQGRACVGEQAPNVFRASP